MPKIIFKCAHMKPGSGAHRAGYVRYMAMREGVRRIHTVDADRPATKKQLALIKALAASYPDTLELFEYEDFQNDSTMRNATEFITRALEDHYVDALGRRQYVSYLATRPGVAKLAGHGLFGSGEGTPSLARVMDEVVAHPGVVWTPIISLRREDADRLGYDRPESWREMLRAKAATFAEGLKIPPGDLVWYAAFHDEGHHPHAHMVCWSKNAEDGFLTVNGIRTIKSGLVRHIFRNELYEVYTRQTQYRSDALAEAEGRLRECIRQMRNGTSDDPQVMDQMEQLADKLRHHSGKMQYGYLRPPAKALVNAVVDALASDSRVAGAYECWCTARREVLSGYSEQPADIPPLSQNEVFKPVRNMVVREAAALLREEITVESLLVPEPDEPAMLPPPLPDAMWDTAPDAQMRAATDDEGPEEARPYVKWTGRYKQALQCLYGTKTTLPNFAQAYTLLLEEANAGNALAMHDMGRMHKDGFGMEADPGQSYDWYAKALSAFHAVEAEKPGRYVWYRIGKMYASGLGTLQYHMKAAEWFQKSAAEGYKYAQYSLGCLHRDGKGVPLDHEKAFDLFHAATDQDFPYASFECGKMCRDDIGTQQNAILAQEYFTDAFTGFVALEEERPDDKLQYRIGWMLLTGTGTVKDISRAEHYFEKASRLGNTYAQYQLAKLILDEEHPDPARFDQAIRWLRVAAKHDNNHAQYALAKLCHSHPALRDIDEAIYWYVKAAYAGNQYAQYRLGKLCLAGEDVPRSTLKGIRWLEAAAEQNNQHAQYALGMAFVDTTGIHPNGPLAVHWLGKAAEQGNIHAAYQLGKLHLSGELVAKDAAAGLRWMTTAAEQDNQHAQYALGKYYLFGYEQLRDEAAAIHWLTQAAQQGHVYAVHLLENRDAWGRGAVMLAPSHLLADLARVFEQRPPEYGAHTPAPHIDRKRMQKLRQRAGENEVHIEEPQPEYGGTDWTVGAARLDTRRRED